MLVKAEVDRKAIFYGYIKSDSHFMKEKTNMKRVMVLITIVIVSLISLCVLCSCGKTICQVCNGEGKIECNECYGSGEVESDEVCSYCNGDGMVTVSYNPNNWSEQAVGGWEDTCPECGGKGYTTEICSNCNGAGEITCEKCHGEGEY